MTVDALYDRIVHFSYENEPDPLAESKTAIRKELYNRNDDPRFSETLKTISADCQKAQKTLHEKETYTDKNGKEHRRYVDQKLMHDGKDAYRKEQRDANGKLYDELSGNSSDTERLEVDHIQAAATARYNSRYLNTPEAVEAMKEFYNSSDNFQMLEKRANSRGEKCSSGILWLLRPAGQKYRIRGSPKESSANAASCNRERSNPEWSNRRIRFYTG